MVVEYISSTSLYVCAYKDDVRIHRTNRDGLNMEEYRYIMDEYERHLNLSKDEETEAAFLKQIKDLLYWGTYLYDGEGDNHRVTIPYMWKIDFDARNVELLDLRVEYFN